MLSPDEEGDCYELLRAGKHKELRTNAGRTLNSVATELDIPRSTIARYEHGSYPVRGDYRERYYRLLCKWRTQSESKG